jgi:ADP-ribosylglycohydrolase
VTDALDELELRALVCLAGAAVGDALGGPSGETLTFPGFRVEAVDTVEQAANFGRDTDTIATMAGAVCAALSGPASIPPPWLDMLGKEALTSARRLGERLARTARAKAASRQRDAGAVAGLLPIDSWPGPFAGILVADVQRTP